MNARFLAIIGTTLLFASGACAAGKYQRTEDGKTRVWNSNPRIKATAIWTGDRDENGYATGRGTLTWFRADRSFLTGSMLPNSKSFAVGHFTGDMVRGKFEGKVITETAEGEPFHATFAKGVMKGEWAAGGLTTTRESKRERQAATRQEAVADAPAEGPQPVPSPTAKPEFSPVPKSKPENVVQHHAVEKPVAVKPIEAKPIEEKPVEASDSLESLAAPPSSLRPSSATEPSPAPSVSSASPSP